MSCYFVFCVSETQLCFEVASWGKGVIGFTLQKSHPLLGLLFLYLRMKSLDLSNGFQIFGFPGLMPGLQVARLYLLYRGWWWQYPHGQGWWASRLRSLQASREEEVEGGG